MLSTLLPLRSTLKYDICHPFPPLALSQAASFHSALHARLRQTLAHVQSRGRKRVHKNLLTPDGHVDRTALLGALGSWVFNYNTVEAVMLFAAVIVCLLAVLYDSTGTNDYPGTADTVTGLLLFVIISSIIYYVTVLVTEIVVLYNERSSSKAKRLSLSRPKSMDLGTSSLTGATDPNSKR